MTDSIFDPTGGQTEHSGSRNLGPAASNNSHMPTSVTDGVVETDEEAADTSNELEEIAAAEKSETAPVEQMTPAHDPARESTK